MIKMFKKIFAGALLSLTTLFVKSSSSVPFSFDYRIVSSGNTASELVHLYEVKEYMLIQYDNLIVAIEDDEISQVINDNYQSLLGYEDSAISFENGQIEIIIGEGNGIAIEGKFKQSYCDNSTINGRYFIIDEILK